MSAGSIAQSTHHNLRPTSVPSLPRVGEGGYMFVFRFVRNELLVGSSAIAIFAVIGAAAAQEASGQAPAQSPGSTQIPQITVTAPKRTPARPRPTAVT